LRGREVEQLVHGRNRSCARPLRESPGRKIHGLSEPSFDGAGLEIAYVIRVLVDRRFRTDAAIERPVGIV
jgi:hypothetical protein